MYMAYERRRLSTESEKSSTSTTHSTESITTHPDQNLFVKKSVNINTTKRTPVMSSPAEILLARTKNSFIDLNPYFQCSSLPSHWRKNKSLRFILRTKNQMEVKGNTRVVILAGNDYNPCATLKNNISWFRGNQAEFNDLRFLGASGRGKKFTLSIIVETNPPQQCTYRRAIKITVDGPRKKRELKAKSDANDIHGDESNFDGDSDNETRTTNTSIKTENKPTISQGSAGLLLLAAAAEQKRKDEEDESINGPWQIPCLTSCFSPTSVLVSQFSQSIDFSPPLNDLSSNLSRQTYPNNSSTISNIPTTNLILSLSSTSNRFENYHPQQRRGDQQTIVNPSTTSTSTSNPTSTSTHILCR